MSAGSILANPYWQGWPKPSNTDDELKARLFVDGYVDGLTRRSNDTVNISSECIDSTEKTL